MSFDLSDYKDVPARIVDFKAKHPEGCLRPADPTTPYRIETIGSQSYVVFVAAAYRTPDDPTPGIGTAWEPWPGRTPYTKDSELQNAETSAWGRAIVAVLASESKNIASREDVRNRQEAPQAAPAGDGHMGRINALGLPAKDMAALRKELTEQGVPWPPNSLDEDQSARFEDVLAAFSVPAVTPVEATK